jgi:Cu2+-exporting ATPase
LVLESCLPLPRLARVVTPGHGEVLVAIERLRVGDVFAVGADEAVPADARILEGDAIVDERSVKGLKGTSRKRAGDDLYAGTLVLAGALQAEVIRPGAQTRASSLGRALVSATSPAPGPLCPTLRGEAFADRTVGPTLAAAGLGLLVGDVAAAGAILRPDYATGPGLSFPLELLRDAALCYRRGIVLRQSDVFERLESVDLLIIEDSEPLHRGGLVVDRVQTRMPKADLLRYAASAYQHVVDERSTALGDACRSRGVHVLDLPVVGFEPGVTVAAGRRLIRVREFAGSVDGPLPLVVEIDDTMVGLIEFVRSGRSHAASALVRVRERVERPLALVSTRAEFEAAATADAVGAEFHRCVNSPDELAELLRECRSRGLKTAFVGD